MNTKFLALESKLKRLLLTGSLLALKAEFEAEGTRIDELAALSDLCCKNNVPFTLKIGGPSAQRDIYEAFQLSATNIMAPMIESSSAILSFYDIFKKYLPAFKGLKNRTNIYINIESHLGVQNFESIIDTIVKNRLPIKCLVIGRSDLSSSLGKVNVNSEEIFEISKLILEKSNNYQLPVAIGGNLTKNSFQFINRLAALGLHAFESRKCTYKLDSQISPQKFENLTQKGLEFELAWLEYKKQTYLIRSDEENIRIKSLNSRISI